MTEYKLSKEKEEALKVAIQQGCYGVHCGTAYPNQLKEYFMRNAIETLLQGKEKEYDFSICYHILVSLANNGDEVGLRSMVQDWCVGQKREVVNISKFIPGEHYHVLRTKFNSYGAAKKWIEANGYCFGQFIEKHVYPTPGD